MRTKRYEGITEGIKKMLDDEGEMRDGGREEGGLKESRGERKVGRFPPKQLTLYLPKAVPHPRLKFQGTGSTLELATGASPSAGSPHLPPRGQLLDPSTP